jgi:opacity protein-like surface antigen
MLNTTIITAATIALTTTAAAAAPDRPPPPKRAFVGLNAGFVRSAATGNRIAASGWGAAFRGEFGYRLVPSVTLPYVTAGATWGRGDAPEWEVGGYPERARYLGLYATQLTAGGLYRHPLAADLFAAYGGPAVLVVWPRREAQTWYGGTMESTSGSGFGWALAGGLEFAPGGGQTLSLQLLYGRAYSAWSGLPTGADDGFTFEQLQIGGVFRFFLF